MGKEHTTGKIYPTKLSGNETDGRFRWNLFDGLIVEFNYDSNLMVVHAKMPNHIVEDKSYSKLNLKFYNNIFLVEAFIAQSRIKYKK